MNQVKNSTYDTLDPTQCDYHKNYKAKRKPTTLCCTCWCLYLDTYGANNMNSKDWLKLASMFELAAKNIRDIFEKK